MRSKSFIHSGFASGNGLFRCFLVLLGVGAAVFIFPFFTGVASMTVSSFGGLTGLSGISAAFDSLFGNLKSSMPTAFSAARSAPSLFFRCRAVRSRK